MKENEDAIFCQRTETDMKELYEFDYSKAKPNRFAERFEAGTRMVVLDPDVAAVFQTPEDVNNVLRALIATMPKRGALSQREQK